jgi:hypothetical protein
MASHTANFVALPRWTLLSATLVVIGMAVPGSRTSAQADPPRLELEEIFALSVPDSFDLAGVHATPSGTVILWAVNQPYIVVYRGGQEQVVRSASLAQPIAAWIGAEDSVIEVVDAERRSIFYLGWDGRSLEERSLPVGWNLESATRLPSGWVIGGRDNQGDYQILIVEPGGEPRLLHSLKRGRYGAAGPLAVHLSPEGDRVLVTLIRSPFSIFRLGRGGEVDRVVPQVQRALMPSRDSIPLWISLPAVALDRGIVRTLSDLRSDTRVFTLYDPTGRDIRQSEIDVPLGFVMSVPDSRLLAAVRKTMAVEVVGYRWRWSDGH